MEGYFAKIGLRELITEKHGKKGSSTTRRNKNHKVVDGIWGTIGLSIEKLCYLPYRLVIKSDHHLIWVKIPGSVALGSQLSLSKSPASRKLRMHHPKGQNKYTLKLKQLERQHNLIPRISQIEEYQFHPQSVSAVKEYEEIYRLLISSIIKSNDSVIKLHMSEVQSSRTVKLSQLRLRLSNLIK